MLPAVFGAKNRAVSAERFRRCCNPHPGAVGSTGRRTRTKATMDTATPKGTSGICGCCYSTVSGLWKPAPLMPTTHYAQPGHDFEPRVHTLSPGYQAQSGRAGLKVESVGSGSGGLVGSRSGGLVGSCSGGWLVGARRFGSSATYLLRPACTRSTAEVTALREAVTMFGSVPTPQATTLSSPEPTSHSTYAAASASPPADRACSE
jgi:hypothetical protein